MPLRHVLMRILRGYRNRNIYVLSDRQGEIKALDNSKIYSKLVWDCHRTLMILADRSRVHLMWVQGHKGIDVNHVMVLGRTRSRLWRDPGELCTTP
jgi:hypothetical protein